MCRDHRQDIERISVQTDASKQHTVSNDSSIPITELLKHVGRTCSICTGESSASIYISVHVFAWHGHKLLGAEMHDRRVPG